MAVVSADGVMVERGGVLYKTTAGEIGALGGGGGGGTSGLTLLSRSVISTPVAAVDITLASGYTRFKLYLTNFSFSHASTWQARMQLSTDGGATFISTSDYKTYMTGVVAYGSASTTTTNTATLSGFILTPYAGGIANAGMTAVYDMVISSTSMNLHGTINYDTTGLSGHMRKNTAALPNAVRVYSVVDNFSTGTISLYGYQEAP
jgi:hypothetical protein